MSSGSPWNAPTHFSSNQPLPLSGETSYQPVYKNISMSHIPPPPIIFSTPPKTLSEAPMEVKFKPYVPQRTPQQSSPQDNYPFIPKRPELSSVAQGQSDVQALLTDFQRDLDDILTRTFGSAAARDLQMNIKFGSSSSGSCPRLNRSAPPQQLQPKPNTCARCSSPLFGVGDTYTCEDCNDTLVRHLLCIQWESLSNIMNSVKVALLV